MRRLCVLHVGVKLSTNSISQVCFQFYFFLNRLHWGIVGQYLNVHYNIRGNQPMVLVSFVTLWPTNCDTSPFFLRDTFDAKMLRKWHPGKPNAKFTCQAISPVHYVQSYTYSLTQRTLLFLENVRTFPGNTTKFINSSDLISLMHANS